MKHESLLARDALLYISTENTTKILGDKLRVRFHMPVTNTPEYRSITIKKSTVMGNLIQISGEPRDMCMVMTSDPAEPALPPAHFDRHSVLIHYYSSERVPGIIIMIDVPNEVRAYSRYHGLTFEKLQKWIEQWAEHTMPDTVPNQKMVVVTMRTLEKFSWALDHGNIAPLKVQQVAGTMCPAFYETPASTARPDPRHVPAYMPGHTEWCEDWLEVDPLKELTGTTEQNMQQTSMPVFEQHETPTATGLRKLKKGEADSMTHPCTHQPQPDLPASASIVLNPTERKEEVKKQVTFAASCLDPAQQAEIISLIQEFHEVALLVPRDRTVSTVACVHLETCSTKPVASKPFRTGPQEKAIIEAWTEKMMAQGLVKRSQSPWASPLLLISKGSAPPDLNDLSRWRVTQDCRQLNKVLVFNAGPLPRTDDILHQLHSVKFMTALDLADAFHQLVFDEESQRKCAFVTHNGLYQPVTMSMGLSVAAQIFQSALNVTFHGLPFVHVYLDDILVVSKTYEEHKDHLRLALERLLKYRFRLNMKKCSFCAREIEYLGYVLSAAGLTINPKRIKIFLRLPPPTNRSEVLSFLGCIGYYRQWLMGWAALSKPLYELTELTRAYIWTEECQIAYETMLQALQKAPILQAPDFTQNEGKPLFKLYCDASGYALGGALCQDQIGPNGKKYEAILGYHSRLFNKGERAMFATRRECIAMADCFRAFKPIIYAQQLTVFTDCAALEWLLKGNPKCKDLNKYAMLFQSQRCTVQYLPGIQNKRADWL
jgi:hypothetical protein